MVPQLKTLLIYHDEEDISKQLYGKEECESLTFAHNLRHFGRLRQQVIAY